MFKITYFKKFTFSKSHFQLNSHFQNHIFTKITFQHPIFHKNHILEAHFLHKSHFGSPFFTKIAFSKSHTSQKSHNFKYQIQVNLWTKSVFLPQCEPLSFYFSSKQMSWYRDFRQINGHYASKRRSNSAFFKCGQHCYCRV